MKVDSKNRVRFTRDGIRFVVSKNGVRAYERSHDWIGDTEYAMNRDRTARAVYNNLNSVSRALALVRLSSWR